MGAPAVAFPGYKMLKLLGKGGMGEVFLAEDEALGRRVAIKTLTPTPEGRARFLREARSLATLDHPRVVRIYSYGETSESPFFVMEYVEGETLADRLTRGRLPFEEVARISRQIIEGLGAAQRRGLVHRDIKPSNVLIDAEEQVHVADFGLARTADKSASLTSTGHFAGSPHYMAPEQARGLDVDFHADMYSLGIVMYEMITGQRPFDGGSGAEILSRHLTEPVPRVTGLRPETPPWLASMVEGLTRKDPGQRPQSYEAVLRAISQETTLSPQDTDGTMTSTMGALHPKRSQGGRNRKRPLWIGATVVGLLLLGGACWYFLHRRPPGALVVVVAPFSAEDPTAGAEGRTMATLIQDEIERLSDKDQIFVVGPGDSDRSPGTESGARRLREAQDASFVVWGRVFKLGNRTDIEARLTTSPGSPPLTGWPEPLSVDDSRQGLEARRQLAHAVAAAVAGGKR
ncbi:MAG: serine/threonine-protein kinase [Vicinamibacteria bacterium]